MDVQELADLCLANSERWFPANHVDDRTAITHCTLGLAGEAGETANKVKKLFGYFDRTGANEASRAAIREELVDTLIYDLVLLALLDADVAFEIQRKIDICEERWGAKAA